MCVLFTNSCVMVVLSLQHHHYEESGARFLQNHCGSVVRSTCEVVHKGYWPAVVTVPLPELQAHWCGRLMPECIPPKEAVGISVVDPQSILDLE